MRQISPSGRHALKLLQLSITPNSDSSRWYEPYMIQRHQKLFHCANYLDLCIIHFRHCYTKLFSSAFRWRVSSCQKKREIFRERLIFSALGRTCLPSGTRCFYHRFILYLWFQERAFYRLLWRCLSECWISMTMPPNSPGITSHIFVRERRQERWTVTFRAYMGISLH